MRTRQLQMCGWPENQTATAEAAQEGRSWRRWGPALTEAHLVLILVGRVGVRLHRLVVRVLVPLVWRRAGYGGVELNCCTAELQPAPAEAASRLSALPAGGPSCAAARRAVTPRPNDLLGIGYTRTARSPAAGSAAPSCESRARCLERAGHPRFQV